MTTQSLETRLRGAADHEEWIAAVADCFSRGGVFFGHGTDNAEDEAYWLLRHLENWDDALWARAPDPALIPRVVELVVRRVEERKPLAYLLGEAWFAGLRFEVNESVLIPRSPLAEIIERGFSPWVTLTPGRRVLDVGTGSGCLAIAVAHYCPGVRVDATDVSSAALETARRNVARHALTDRVDVLEADLLPENGHRYSVIMSNPPYVPDATLAAMPEEYAHEPAVALAGGRDGLEPTERLLRAAGSRLEQHGILVVEVGAEADRLTAAHPRVPFLWLEFERGGEGVFVLTAAQLAAHFG